MSEEVLEKNDLTEGESFTSLSIGGEVGESGETKKVNFHKINRNLERDVAYDITSSILALQVEPFYKLHRNEKYELYI